MSSLLRCGSSAWTYNITKKNIFFWGKVFVNEQVPFSPVVPTHPKMLFFFYFSSVGTKSKTIKQDLTDKPYTYHFANLESWNQSTVERNFRKQTYDYEPHPQECLGVDSRIQAECFVWSVKAFAISSRVVCSFLGTNLEYRFSSSRFSFSPVLKPAITKCLKIASKSTMVGFIGDWVFSLWQRIARWFLSPSPERSIGALYQSFY